MATILVHGLLDDVPSMVERLDPMIAGEFVAVGVELFVLTWN